MHFILIDVDEAAHDLSVSVTRQSIIGMSNHHGFY